MRRPLKAHTPSHVSLSVCTGTEWGGEGTVLLWTLFGTGPSLYSRTHYVNDLKVADRRIHPVGLVQWTVSCCRFTISLHALQVIALILFILQ